MLGVYIHYDTDVILEKNYKMCINKMETVLKQWSKRNMSLCGKVTLINSLLGSLFVYKMSVIPSMHKSQFEKIDEMLETFIWNGRRPKIPLHVLMNSKTSGGLKLVNMRMKDHALKATWPWMLEKNEKLANIVYANIAPYLDSDIWRCNLQAKQINMIIEKKVNPFWYDVMESVMLMKQSRNEDSDFLWYNKEICIDNSPCFWLTPYQKGLKVISDLYDEGRLKSMYKLYHDFNLSLMQANSLISAIPKRLKDKYRTTSMVVRYEGSCSAIYESLIDDNTVLAKKCKQREMDLNIQIDYAGFLKSFRNIYSVSNIPKYRSFQYWLIQRAVTTNIHLKHWNMKEDDLCTFCRSHRETYVHLFVHCEKVKPIWLSLENWMQNFSEDKIDFSEENVIWNVLVDEPSRIDNFLCLVTKQYIYRQRCLGRELSYQELRRSILNIRDMEKYIATKNKKLDKHYRKWDINYKKTSPSSINDQTNQLIHQYLQNM